MTLGPPALSLGQGIEREHRSHCRISSDASLPFAVDPPAPTFQPPTFQPRRFIADGAAEWKPRSRLLDHRRAESLPRPAPAPATVPIGHDPRKRQECQKKRAAAGPPLLPPVPQLLADRIEVYAALLS